VTVEGAVAKLRELHYLDDDTFAQNWARSRAESRGYGPKRIEQELRTKGIAPSLIREVLGKTFAPGEEATRAKLTLAKKFKNQQLDDKKMLRRAVGFLRRRGYSSSVIFDLLKGAVEDD
jgi:regulatory protein